MRITIHEDADLETALAKLTANGPDEQLELAAIRKAASDMYKELQKLKEHGAGGEFKKTVRLGQRKIELVTRTKSNLSLFDRLVEYLGIR